MSALGMLNHIFQEDCNIRFLTLQDEKFYYKAADVARFLGYQQTQNAVSRYVKDEDKIEIGERTVRTSPTIYISESAMYKFFMKSKQPKARIFQEWVCTHAVEIYMQQNNISIEQIMRRFLGARLVRIN